MRLTTIEIERFTAFQGAILEFSPGINVFIGVNGTGKSHLLKLLYSALKAKREVALNGQPAGNLLGVGLAKKLAGVYRPDDGAIKRLVNRRVGRSKAVVRLRTDDGGIDFRLTTQGNLYIDRDDVGSPAPCVFIPSREALAMFEGFIRAYEERELSFDETYKDLCVALSGNPLKGRRLGEVSRLAQPLETVLDGRIVLEGGRFYLASPQGNLEAHLLAEGMRKIGALLHLIVNGSLMKNGFLFWDEPEANLNPNLITKVVETLRQLAKFGVQVFLASHDYLLTQRLSLLAEQDAGTRTQFFCLTRPLPDAPVIVSQGPSLADLPENPILTEFARYYDDQRESFESKG